MATLQLFVTQEELDEIIQKFVVQRNLLVILQTRTGYHLTEQLPEPLTQYDDVINIYSFPRNKPLAHPLSEETFLPRRAGAIQIKPGELKQSRNSEVLLLTSISAEDKRDLSFQPATWLRQLKNHIQAKGTVTFGIEGENVVFGGKDIYKSIGYSSLALKLHQRGVLWKQYADDNSIFSPIGNDAL